MATLYDRPARDAGDGGPFRDSRPDGRGRGSPDVGVLDEHLWLRAGVVWPRRPPTTPWVR